MQSFVKQTITKEDKMRIDTKFDIGDIKWLVRNGVLEKVEIIDIKIRVTSMKITFIDY